VKRSRFVLALALGVAVAVGFAASCRRALSADQAAEIRDLFVGDDPASYRLVLPVFEDGRVVRTEVYGSLPLDRVQQIAVRQGIDLREAAQIHAVIVHGANNGGAGSGGGGGGTMQSTPAKKLDRLHEILRRVNPQQYQLVVEQTKPGQ
jgi:hypothetical protein